MTTAELVALLPKVIALATECGEWMRLERQHFSQDHVEHKGPTDLVSYVDRTCEERLVAGLSAMLPQAGFITEEGTVAQAAGGLAWIVDPLDGTTNFVHGLAPYAVSIGLYDGLTPLLGVVYECVSKECFAAVAGCGATLNGKAIHVSATVDLQHALLATGFPYRIFQGFDEYIALMKELITKTQGVRRFGSAAIDLCYTACGRFDGYYECDLKPWDVAAGALIVSEAGGTISHFHPDGDWLHGRRIVASNTHLHLRLMHNIHTFFPTA